MRVKIIGTLIEDAQNGLALSVTLLRGRTRPTPIKKRLTIDPSYDPDCSEPLQISGLIIEPKPFDQADKADSPDGIWVFRRKGVRVDDAKGTPHDELVLRIKHAVLREEKALARISREVKAFENMEHVSSARRGRIPEPVRLFVWQRDEGKCVRCESRERLEFDHIIPVALGGSNTDRNIQLLCERCNREKGKNV
jgi:hypothetical protein